MSEAIMRPKAKPASDDAVVMELDGYDGLMVSVDENGLTIELKSAEFCLTVDPAVAELLARAAAVGQASYNWSALPPLH